MKCHFLYRTLLLVGIFTILTGLKVFRCHAQHFEIDTLVAEKNPHIWQVYRFPVLKDTSFAAGRINDWLYTTMLNIPHGNYEESPFEKIWPEEESSPGVTRLNFEVNVNSRRYLSITVTGEYTSARLSDFTIVYNFDAQSGRPVILNDLLSQEGFKKLRDSLVYQRKKEIHDFLATVDTTREGGAEQHRIYSDCLQQIETDNLYHNDLRLYDTSVKITRPRCSTRYNQSYDELWYFENELDLITLRPYLNEYGRCLFFEGSDRCGSIGHDRLHVGLYQGVLDDDLLVSLYVEDVYEDGSVNAFYILDRNGSKIRLHSSVQPDDTYRLSEKDENNQMKNIFYIKPTTGFKLVGTWTNADSTVSYPVTLE